MLSSMINCGLKGKKNLFVIYSIGLSCHFLFYFGSLVFSCLVYFLFCFPAQFVSWLSPVSHCLSCPWLSIRVLSLIVLGPLVSQSDFNIQFLLLLLELKGGFNESALNRNVSHREEKKKNNEKKTKNIHATLTSHPHSTLMLRPNLREFKGGRGVTQAFCQSRSETVQSRLPHACV